MFAVTLKVKYSNEYKQFMIFYILIVKLRIFRLIVS